MTLLFIIPYFGKLPNYFDLFLKSCEKNSDFNWLIITDDTTKYNYPSNMKVIYEDYNTLKNKIASKFDFEVNLERPHKLCDFKPAYGYIFSEYIKDYEFWGHCDLDCIFGDLKKYITRDILENYDKIFTLGHLTLYRNCDEINKAFMNKIDGKLRYKEVFNDIRGFAFDEKRSGSINDIFLESNYAIYQESFCADIDPYQTNFRLSIYNFENDKYNLENTKKNLFYWNNGILKRMYEINGKLVSEEYAYIHLQKRRMKKSFYNINEIEDFLIVPNEFIQITPVLDIEVLKRYLKKRVFNSQYFKVKFNSLKYRIEILKNNIVNWR